MSSLRLLVLCERSAGLAQSGDESGVSSTNSFERIAPILVKQCLVTGQDPANFLLLVAADDDFVDAIRSRAKQLLKQVRTGSAFESLSPRQCDVLLCVARHQSNKEIASVLNLSVATVKCHISSLLHKFGVENRAELARRAAGLLQSRVL